MIRKLRNQTYILTLILSQLETKFAPNDFLPDFTIIPECVEMLHASIIFAFDSLFCLIGLRPRALIIPMRASDRF